MTGIGQNLFDPQGTSSRAMVVTVLYRLAGSPDVTSPMPFTDVNPNTWYSNAIIWAHANNIVSGVGGGLFGTSNNITRQDLATILFNFSNVTGIELPVTVTAPLFTDNNQIANYAQTAVSRFVQAGIISGRPDGTFDPTGNATRAELAAMLYRFLQVADLDL